MITDKPKRIYTVINNKCNQENSQIQKAQCVVENLIKTGRQLRNRYVTFTSMFDNNSWFSEYSVKSLSDMQLPSCGMMLYYKAVMLWAH